MNASVDAEILMEIEDTQGSVDIGALQNYEALVEKTEDVFSGVGGIQRGPKGHFIVGNYLLTKDEAIEFADVLLEAYTKLATSLRAEQKDGIRKDIHGGGGHLDAPGPSKGSDKHINREDDKPQDPWMWKMEYCKNNNLPPAQNWAWDIAERAHQEQFGEVE